MSDTEEEETMTDLITKARLAEIKARTTLWSLDERTQKLAASYERAVELLRVMADSKDGYHKTLMPSSAIEFLEEFDHE